MSAYAGQIVTPKADKPDPRFAESGEECKACGFITTNSMPDCRCS